MRRPGSSLYSVLKELLVSPNTQLITTTVRKERPDRKITNLVSFLLFGKKPRILSLEQITPILHRIRDHKLYRVYLGDYYNAVCGNVTKKANGKNTGFVDHRESDKEYLDRMRASGKETADLIDDNTFCLLLEEFAIKEKDINSFLNEVRKKPGWENLKCHVNKSSGLMTCFKNEMFENVFHTNEKLTEFFVKHKMRCQVYNPNDSTTLAHVHSSSPRKKASAKTTEEFQTIAYTILNEKCSDFTTPLKCVVLIGDTNQSPASQKKLIEAAAKQISDERVAAGKKPLSFTFYHVNSHDGHLENDNGKPVHTTVDSGSKILISESTEYQFKHIPENTKNEKLKYLLSLLIGSTVFTANMALDDVLAVAAEVTATMFFRDSFFKIPCVKKIEDSVSNYLHL